jgi:hypothetical protein
LGGQVVAAPHVKGLNGVVSVVDAAAMEVFVLAQRLPHRRRAVGGGPLEVQLRGRNRPPQGRDGHLVGALAIATLLLAVARREQTLGGCRHQFGRESHAPNTERGDGSQRLEPLADYR